MGISIAMIAFFAYIMDRFIGLKILEQVLGRNVFRIILRWTLALHIISLKR